MNINQGGISGRLLLNLIGKHFVSHYLNKKLFNIGDIVENINTGLIGKS